MDETGNRRLARLEKSARLWRWFGLAAVLLAVGSLGVRPLVAQQSKTAKAAMEYRQSACLWTSISSVANDWEGKGWELFQVVPIHPENPGAGAKMQVAVVFRRPSK